ncbi:MAG: ACP S-malonyltransferase [Armatimonadota bacterium]
MTSSLTAGLFPGQGSQAVGMGKELSEQYVLVKQTFAEADDILGFSLSQLCFEGPTDELKRTSNAQPALVTISTAYWRVLSTCDFTCAVVAGHSLGEYSALVAAGALKFADALRLVRRRGLLMEEAAEGHPGAMAAIIGLSDEDVRALCADVAATYGTLAPANYNAPGQVVVSGESAAIAAVRTAAKERGAKAIPLAVSGPFHSPLMQSAADAFGEELNKVEICPPQMPVVSNVTAQPTTDPAAIRDALARQITGSVQWVGSLYAMRDMGVQRYVEIGPGNVLSGLVQRTLPEAATAPVHELLAE